MSSAKDIVLKPITAQEANELVRRVHYSGKVVQNSQLHNIYFIDPTYREKLTVPELPYSEIERRGAGMYKGQPRGRGEIDNAPQSNEETGGASPTRPL